MGPVTDAQLLIRFRMGDEYALEVIFERYESVVYYFLVGILRNHHQAEDALQETFIKALRDSASVDPDRFRGWLFTVAQREALTLKRKQKRIGSTAGPSPLLADPTPSGFEVVDRNDQAQRMIELLEKLPRQQKEVIRARIFEGKRYREIADDIGCPLNTALARMHEGLKKLRQLWDRRHV
jgi:RNA polymerase sigma-70 factor, ECF subfamily